MLGLFREWRNLSDITHLFLLGDIFDLWIADYPYFINKYSQIIEELQRLHSMGVMIHYFEGNHDLYLKHYFANRLGFLVHEESVEIYLDNVKLRLEHGDQMDPTDRGYIFLRWLLRTPFMKFLAPRLPERWIIALGERMSRLSRVYTSEYKSISQERSLDVIRKHAVMTHSRNPFDVLICGHVHTVDDFQWNTVSGKVARVINLGAWFDSARVLSFNGKEWTFNDLGECK